MKFPKIFMLTFLGVLFLAACSTTDVREGAAPGVRVRDPRVPQAGIRFNSVAIIDKSLQSWDGKTYDPPWSKIFQLGPDDDDKYGKIAVEKTSAVRTQTGTLKVWASLRNRTDYSLQLEGRVTFFDRNEMPVDGPTSWNRMHIPPQGIVTYSEYSTDINDVAYYYIEIREGR